MAHRPGPERHESNPTNIHGCPKKRLIICCDGTWQDADSTDTTPSNVARIVRSIPPVGVDYTNGHAKPISQVVYYQNGIGTGGAGLYQKLVGSKISGATGEGLIFNVREAYAFVCANYHRGDDIIIIGFSRGAFTARTVATLIRQLGLLTPKGMSYLVELVDDWEYQLNSQRVSPYPNHPWEKRPNFSDETYHKKLAELKLTRPNIPIKCVAVWDTVGSLGVPATWASLTLHRWFHKICPKPLLTLLPKAKPKDFAFVDTAVLDNIEYAFHALALDEKRESFTPTIWFKPEQQQLPKVLKQTWFPGVHSDVGGSYPNDDNANITLAWMVGQFETYGLVTFNTSYIFRLIHSTIRNHIEAVPPSMRAKVAGENLTKDDRAATFGELTQWGTGKIHESYEGIFWLGGVQVRTPMQYREVNKDHGQTGNILKNTFETMHASVRVRCKLNTKGFDGKHLYKDGAPLKGWEWQASDVADPMTAFQQSQPGEVGRVKGVQWIKRENQGGKMVEVCQMPEDQMTAFEREVLRQWTAAEDWEEDAKLRAEADEREQVLNFNELDLRGSPAAAKQHWKARDFGGVEANAPLNTVVEDNPDDEEHASGLHIATDVGPNPDAGHTPREQIPISAY